MSNTFLDSLDAKLKADWETVLSWGRGEWHLFSTALVVRLKAEIPELEAAGVAALHDLVGQIAQSVEATVTTGATDKKSTFLQRLNEIVSGVGLDLVGGGKLIVKAGMSPTVQNALVEAGAIAVKAGIAALL